MSVAHAVQRLLDGLREAGIDPAITMVPQEVPHPVPFDQDREHRADDPAQFHERPVQPAAGRWDATMGEFLLDYDDPLPCPDPDEAPLQFVTSTYRAGADAAHGDPTLLGSGRPV